MNNLLPGQAHAGPKQLRMCVPMNEAWGGGGVGHLGYQLGESRLGADIFSGEREAARTGLTHPT